MPFKTVTSPKCPRCGKSVYAAEERAVGELKFHKECYKCSMCNKALDSTTVNCHETVLFCKTCYGRKYGPKGVGFGGGAGALSTDTGTQFDYGRNDAIKTYVAPKAAPGEGCPRCGCKVFAAEQMLAKDKIYHKTCFNCKKCNKSLDSTLHCDGSDGHIYCRACYANKFGPKGIGFGGGAGTLSSGNIDAVPLMSAGPDIIIKAGEGEEGCPRCGGKVYSAEQMLAKNRAFHKKCFNCLNCKRPLDSMVHCDGPDGEVYCKLCYAKKYGPKGYGFASGSGGVLTAENILGGEEFQGVKPAFAAIDVSSIRAEEGKGCPRCGGKVFAAEEMFARSRSWHKKCFNCCFCHRPLDSIVGCDAPDGEIYCKLCYAKKYGPKGYGFASGGGGIMTAENINTDNIGEIPNPERARIDVSKIRAAEGQGCPRCGGKVFMAEEINARGRQWHKQCYHCCHCRRPLDSVVGCDAIDGEVYCTLCYAKKYGPKGYGFASGGGGVMTASNIPGGENIDSSSLAYVSIDTAAIRAAPGEGCLRCGGKVFSAEEMLSGRGRKWHKRCYNCLECRRPLDSMVLCDGSDGEIYCKLCYARKFGPKGYGFASGAGGVMFPENLQGNDEEHISSPPPITLSDPTKIPAKDGQAKCPRCGGAVFQAESMFARKREWHKTCFNCVLCHRPLDSMVACDAPDGEIYCTACYAKRHGPKGVGFGHSPALVSLGTDDGVPVPSDFRQFGFISDGIDPEKESRSTITRRIIERRVVDGPRGTEEEAIIPNLAANNAIPNKDETGQTISERNIPVQIIPETKIPRQLTPEQIIPEQIVANNITRDYSPTQDDIYQKTNGNEPTEEDEIDELNLNGASPEFNNDFDPDLIVEEPLEEDMSDFIDDQPQMNLTEDNFEMTQTQIENGSKLTQKGVQLQMQQMSNFESEIESNLVENEFIVEESGEVSETELQLDYDSNSDILSPGAQH